MLTIMMTLLCDKRRDKITIQTPFIYRLLIIIKNNNVSDTVEPDTI